METLSYCQLMERMLAAEEALKNAVPEGYVVVPMIPTEEMLMASYRVASVYSSTAYRAMINAAPKVTK